MTCQRLWEDMQKESISPVPHFYLEDECQGTAYIPEMPVESDVLALTLPPHTTVKSWVIPEHMEVKLFSDKQIEESRYLVELGNDNKVVSHTDLIIVPWIDLSDSYAKTQKAGLDYVRSALIKAQKPFEEYKAQRCLSHEWSEDVCHPVKEEDYRRLVMQSLPEPIQRITEEWPLIYQIIALVTVALLFVTLCYLVYRSYFASPTPISSLASKER